MRKSIGAVAVALPLVVSSFATQAVASGSTSSTSASNKSVATGRAMNAAQMAEVDRFARDHPLDLEGLGKLVKKYTGEDMMVSVAGVSGNVTSGKATQILAKYSEKRTSRSPSLDLS